MSKSKLFLLFNLFFLSQFCFAQWSVAHLSEPRCFPGAVEYQNKVYIAGGYLEANTGVMTNRIDIYDNATNSWSIDSMSSVRGDVSCVAFNNKIYFAGGSTNGFGNAKEVDIYNTTTSSWSVDSLITTQAGAVPVVIGTKIYFAGGTSTVAG